MTNTDTQDAARVAPAAELLSEQVNALVSADTRAYLLGSVEADGARGEAEGRQVRSCDTVYVSGTGGIMSEQTALIVRGG